MPATRTEQAWLDEARARILQGQLPSAQVALNQALTEYPASTALRRAQAGLFQQTGRDKEAEMLLHALLERDVTDVVAAFTLADMLKQQGRAAAAASTLRTCFARTSDCRDADLAIRAIELLDDCDCKADAASITAVAIEANPYDPRLHAYAGMLQIQLGNFELARRHYLFALEHDERAWEWHIPIGLSSAQRYGNAEHPDFALFRNGLHRERLSDKARAELHFALGKAHDDVGNCERATRYFREGNGIAHRLTKWSRKAWRRAVEARLASKPIAHALEPSTEFTPVFIVGMPRSGTTLLARLLSRYPGVCNRGEMPWIARIAEQPLGRGSLQDAAAMYAAQARRDDAGDARWFIDKQPLNFRYLNLMLSMFPHAKIIRCQRNARDTALSLWMQCFLEDVQGYAYDFDDIAVVMRDCDRLMDHWRQRYADAIRTVRYEDLVAEPLATIADLAQWVGLPAPDANEPLSPEATTSPISTASLWQARQPVNTRSIERWRHYAPYMPELLRIPET